MTSFNPSVGVVIPTFNSGKFVKACLLSVVNQKYQPAQIVVCDDGSQDDTLSVVHSIKDHINLPIEVITHAKNIGIPRNFNSGLRRIKTEYVSLVAGDDLWHPEKLRHEVELLKNGVGAVYSACAVVDESGKIVGPFKRKFDGATGRILFEMLMHEMTFRSPLLRMSVLSQIGFFNEDLVIFEDWDLKIRYTAQTRVAYSDFDTVYYRRHGAGISRTANHWEYFKNLKMVYSMNSSLIDTLSLEKRNQVLRRRRSDLGKYLKGSYDTTFRYANVFSKVRWLTELLKLNPKSGLRTAYRMLLE